VFRHPSTWILLLLMMISGALSYTLALAALTAVGA
jgi:hypothetical protein